MRFKDVAHLSIFVFYAQSYVWVIVSTSISANVLATALEHYHFALSIFRLDVTFTDIIYLDEHWSSSEVVIYKEANVVMSRMLVYDVIQVHCGACAQLSAQRQEHSCLSIDVFDRLTSSPPLV